MINNQYCHIFPFVATSVSISIYWYAVTIRSVYFVNFWNFLRNHQAIIYGAILQSSYSKLSFVTLKHLKNKIRYISNQNTEYQIYKRIFTVTFYQNASKISRPTLVLQKTLGLHIKEMRQRINVSLSVVG